MGQLAYCTNRYIRRGKRLGTCRHALSFSWIRPQHSMGIDGPWKRHDDRFWAVHSLVPLVETLVDEGCRCGSQSEQQPGGGHGHVRDRVLLGPRATHQDGPRQKSSHWRQSNCEKPHRNDRHVVHMNSKWVNRSRSERTREGPDRGPIGIAMLPISRASIPERNGTAQWWRKAGKGSRD
jgi:hypothetical protein